jgi:hypothetical protein
MVKRKSASLLFCHTLYVHKNLALDLIQSKEWEKEDMILMENGGYLQELDISFMSKIVH